MAARGRAWGLAGALLLLAALDVVIARVDVISPFFPDTQPTTLFAGINFQLTEAVRALYGRPTGPRPAVFVGNSQLDALIHPFGKLADALVAAGAPPGTRVESLCVFGTAPTDGEVITRDLRALRPGVVVFGISGPDLGTPLERARTMPITNNLDTGWRDGLVPPADLEARLDRWARTAWRLYRYRKLYHDLLLPPEERRTPRAFLEVFHTPAELFERELGVARTQEVLALRDGFARGASFAEALPYLEALRGREYLAGLRDRWRNLAPQPLQLEALRRAAGHVRAAGGRPVWVLLPENPLLALDPEVGVHVRRGSQAIAGALDVLAEEIAVPFVDLRHLLPASRFSDLNHALLIDERDVMQPLATELAVRGLLADDQVPQAQ